MISPAWVRSSSPTITRQRQPAGQLLGAPDGVVVGDAQRRRGRSPTTASVQLLGRGGGVARPHRVAVEVDAHPAGPARRRRGAGGAPRPRGRGASGRGYRPCVVRVVVTGASRLPRPARWCAWPRQRGWDVIGRGEGAPRRGRRRVGGRRRAGRADHRCIVGPRTAFSHDPCGLPARRPRCGYHDRGGLGQRRGGGRGGRSPPRPRVDRRRVRRLARRTTWRPSPVSPVDAYGRRKAAAEAAVAASCPGAVIARPSLLYGDDRLSPAQQAVLDAVDGVAPDGVLHRRGALPVACRRRGRRAGGAVPSRRSAGPLHLGGPDALSRYEFACLVAAWAGRAPELVRPARQADHGVPRPGHVVLDSRRAVRLGLMVRSPVSALSPG